MKWGQWRVRRFGRKLDREAERDSIEQARYHEASRRAGLDGMTDEELAALGIEELVGRYQKAFTEMEAERSIRTSPH